MIYILDKDPKKIAEYLDDKSLDRMIKDIAQVLCNVHGWQCGQRISGNKITQDLKLYKEDMDKLPLKLNATNKNIYAWSQWARECKANYLYLVELGLKCTNEYLYRIHNQGIDYRPMYKYRKILVWAKDNVPDLPGKSCGYQCNQTPFPLVMPKKYIPKHDRIKAAGLSLFPETIIQCYCNYYQAKLIKKIFWCIPRTDQALKDHLIIWTNRNKPEWLNFYKSEGNHENNY